MFGQEALRIVLLQQGRWGPAQEVVIDTLEILRPEEEQGFFYVHGDPEKLIAYGIPRG